RAVALVKGWPRVAAFCAYAYSQEDDYPDLGLIAPDGSATASWVAYTPPAGRRGPAGRPGRRPDRQLPPREGSGDCVPRKTRLFPSSAAPPP
ncbi:MAG TPA: hypothetical protein VNK05_09135, partial [Chloroflexota bacterium]|nr:hypothetical protein [Chloroflexota bacterium]